METTRKSTFKVLFYLKKNVPKKNSVPSNSSCNDRLKGISKQGINTVVRRNNEGRIYGMTFIDHESRTVWNGSSVDRNLSANVFNNWWNNGNKPDLKIQDSPVSKKDTWDELPKKDIFEFLSQQHSSNLDLGVFSSLPDAQGEDYEEEQFVNRMKKKKKGGRRI